MLYPFLLLNNIKNRHFLVHLLGLFQEVSQIYFQYVRRMQELAIYTKHCTLVSKLDISVYFRSLLPCMNVTLSGYILTSAELNM